MQWTEQAVVYLAQMARTDIGDTKKLARAMRKNTELWWRKAWAEWRAADVGLQGVEGSERKARLIDGWQAATAILGKDYRNEAGRRMESINGIKHWHWVRLGRHLRKWMTPTAKSIITHNLIEEHGVYDDELASLARAGIVLEDMTDKYDECGGRDDVSDTEDDDSEEDGIIDLTRGNPRTWDSGAGRKRTAKEVASDETESRENRDKARAWIAENAKRAQAPRGRRKTAVKATHTRTGARSAINMRARQRIQDRYNGVEASTTRRAPPRRSARVARAQPQGGGAGFSHFTDERADY